MKLWSKEALVLGGMYEVVEYPFTYLGFDKITDILFLVFVCCAIMLCFNKTPKFILKTMENYPKTSYYLTSIGWLPYFIFAITLALIVSYRYLHQDNNLLTTQLVYLGIFNFLAILISLIIALVKQKRI